MPLPTASAKCLRWSAQRAAAMGFRLTTGREVIAHLPQATNRPLTPIYLGDDLTDEDAFGAVHDEGVPIVVRHNDDGDRATAALLALDSPAQVAAFTDELARQSNDARVN